MSTMMFDKFKVGVCLLFTTMAVLPLPAAFAQDTHSASASHPSQASVATKTAFATIAASDASLKKALDAKDIAGAQKLIGKAGAYQGTVVEVYSPRSNGIVLVNFAKEHDDAITTVLMHDEYAKFPDMQTLTGKHVLVTGTFSAYKGKPEIVLAAPTQIKIVH